MPDGAGPSPTGLAWRRLRRSPAAMASLAVLALVAVACLAAPLAGDPLRPHAWLGALPPGARHPDCLTDNVLAVGQAAETSPRARAARRLVIEVEPPVASDDWRIALRRGGVRSITLVRGPLARDEPALPATRAREVLADGSLGAERAGAALKVGDPPPADWFGKAEVIILRVAEPPRRERWEATLERGVVASLSRDGVPA